MHRETPGYGITADRHACTLEITKSNPQNCGVGSSLRSTTMEIDLRSVDTVTRKPETSAIVLAPRKFMA
ncbi:hypothetical protein [Paragemmobacter aquarius]|uniref:hypothetical protein n=1 Tax=Paragemmobacter aquarius TaxID=2169400 RepID=UPI00131EE89C|nr:hypothetical protein [Gemmobacter aquarius]